MLRFCGENLVRQREGVNITIEESYLMFDKSIWQNGRDYFKRNGCHDVTRLQIIPVLNAEGGLICYGWQDVEANRELRMLRELEECREALQFNDIFPKIKEVVVCGCSELSYYFVKYLEKRKISVSVKGKYWEYLGYESVDDVDFDDNDKMIIYAECILENKRNLFERVIRSASSEFECINKIYESNILADKIRDKGGDLEWMLGKLKGKDVAIIGIDEKAQDVYDFLYEHGIDVKWFVSEDQTEKKAGLLLGKIVAVIEEVLRHDVNVAFIDVYNKNSKWGNKYVELLDYYGYKRNECFFAIQDYVNVACSNLIHIFRGKSVFLTGDERLCKILAEYLNQVEQGDICLRYTEKLQPGMLKENEILCTACIWYGSTALNKKVQFLGEYLMSVPHTDYFSRAEVFVNIDQYKTGYIKKYSLRQLIPKGILLNITDSCNGNEFIQGVIDGHSDVLLMQYNIFGYNLFVYCIRLSIEKSVNILSVFQLMLKEEISDEEFRYVFPYWDIFKRNMERWLSQREQFTSQELFVIFHIAYMEMMSGKKIADLSQKVIYFDPHLIPPWERICLAKWLESDVINGQIITIRRDNIQCLSSKYKRNLANVSEGEELKFAHSVINWMVREAMDISMELTDILYFKSLEMRFEDLKLHSREELPKICDRLKISWSDSLLRTTLWGSVGSIDTIRNFDLKPVFDKHEEYWSAFDRFRLYLICSPYQKKYGYAYENCMKFSRKELQEMFLKEFQFQGNMQFDSEERKAAYYLWAYESIRWKLWENRKYFVADDFRPEFQPIKIGKSEKELQKELNIEVDKQIKRNRDHLVELVKANEKLVIYGLGKDGIYLWNCLEESVQSRLVLCDKKAQSETYYFYGKQVIRPEELCTIYNGYGILVTSSTFYREIYAELVTMGIQADRIICNNIPLWEKDE